MAYDSYVGKRLKEDFEDIAYPILKKGKAEFNSIEDYEIDVILLERKHEEWGETFTVSCHLIISLEDGDITEIEFDDRAWGGDGLGDYNPDEVYTSAEQKRIDRTARELLKAITE